MTIDRESDKAIRVQAVRLTEAAFLKISPRPLRTINQVAPVVYALLIDGIDPRTIERALIDASVHTANGISYALHQIMPGGDKTAPPRHPDIQPAGVWKPSDAEKAHAQEKIAEMRAILQGGKKSPA